MLIYIIHNDRYYTFRLPKTIAGNYVLDDYDENGDKRSLVNINVVDGKWVMNSNENVKITPNNQVVNSIQLLPYYWYLLTTIKGEKILLYAQAGYENNYVMRKVEENTKLTVGMDGGNDIVYGNKSVGKKQLELTYKNGRWTMKNLNTSVPVYVNTMKRDNILLDNFDNIFLFGLKIKVLGNILFINNPNNQLLSLSSKLLETQDVLCVEDKQSAGTYSDFYESDEYYSKSPVFVKKNTVVNVPITAPENKEQSGNTSFLMQMVPSVVMQFTSVIYFFDSFKQYKAGQMDESTFMMSLITMASMIFISFVWPFIERTIEKFHSKVRERMRISTYKKYLKGKRETLEEIKNNQKTALLFNYLSLKECQDIILKKNTNLFSIGPEQDRFLKFRIGLGRMPMSADIGYTKPDFIKQRDKLLDLIDELIKDYKYVDDVPYVLSLANNIAFINSKAEYYKYYEAIILKLITFHDYNNLKIVAFTSENSRLNSIRSLNHCWDNERSMRFVATNPQDAEALSSYLMRIFNKRTSSNGEGGSLPYYFIICDEIEKYKNIKIINTVLKNNAAAGFSVISFAEKVNDVPEAFHTFIDYNDTEASMFQSEMQENSIEKFKPELITDEIDYGACIRQVSNVPIRINDERSGQLPDKIGFLEMYGVGNVEQLNSNNRWKDAKIISSLAAPIGVDSNNNTLYLDLHEKKHGPHGLIAGMTGSGKSEFIVTYILSLAVNYSPDEVQFVLIDYKGGGLAGAFENRKTGIKLPHLVGTITNLDVSEMNRTLVSIKSELERRQKIFNAVKEQLNTGTIDIYKYQSLYREGAIKEPLSHLFIICDEFAELKQSQPEFMDEIVSTSRIGRSLGIHLILATQKPAGVVDEQVWSNSKFKVCCRVQTVEDSKEMLRNEDAAYLKQSGRFYLQVGYDEYYVLGQSGYSGTSYIPSETAVSRFDNSISFVTDLGEVYKSINSQSNEQKEDEKKNGEELTNVVKYIIDTAKTENYEYHQLWLDNIPETIYYEYLIKKYGIKPEQYNINPVIGEYDNPRNQSQGCVTLPITNGGNTYIMGSSRSGKNTLLSTMIYSTLITHNSEEVNFYIIDFGAEKLKKFARAPQVGDVLTMENMDKIKYLMYMLQIEQYKRQQYYSENGGDFLYDVKMKQCPFPNIIVVIYDIDVFKETTDYMFEETIVPLARSSSKYGINFVITGTNANTLGYNAANNFPQKIVLNMTDDADMSSFFEHPPVIKKNAGRGLVQIDGIPYEFQVPLIFKEEEEIKNLNYVIEQLNQYLKTKAKPVPTIPEEVTYDNIKEEVKTLSRVPLGIDLVTAQIGGYNFTNPVNVISSAKSDVLFKWLPGVFNVLNNTNNTKVIVLNTFENTINAPEGIKVYDSAFKKVIPILSSNIDKFNSGEKESDEQYVIMVLGYAKLNKHLVELKAEDPSIKTIDELIIDSRKNNNFKFALYDDKDLARDMKHSAIADLIDTTSGIWLGRGFDSQSIIDSNSYNDNIQVTDEVVVTVSKGKPTFLKSVK